MVRWCLAALVAVLQLIFSLAPAHAQPPAQRPAADQDAPSDAIAHAVRVEQRAMQTSFADLEAFGAAAATRNDAEGLSRLQHVAWIVMNQGDFEKADHWNRQLQDAAQRQDNARYSAVARINALRIRHLRDHDVSLADMEALAAAQTDWLPTVFARTAQARRLFDESRVGDAIRLMAQTIPLIPHDRATEASVAAAAWDLVSIAHVMIDDVPGHLKAVDHAERYMAASDYPRPDHESLYNLTQSLAFLGRHDEAQTLATSYGRLAARTDTPTSRGYAGNICAFAAASREDWPAVLQCLAPFGPDLAAPDIVANAMLTFRATAHARTGDVALARRDVDEIHRRVAEKRMAFNSGARRAEAEYLIASGDHARGVPALRQYHLTRFQRASQSSAAAMEQVVATLDEQIDTISMQNDLKSQVISFQTALVALLILAAAGFAALFWNRNQLTQKLAMANRRERESHEAKSAFFANMSHEIRTPLNGVVAMADALKKTSLDDAAAHMVGIIASSSNTLERLLSDILDDAKMEAGEIAIETAPFDLGATLNDVHELWRQKAHDKGVALEAHIDPGASRWAQGDSVRLSQVLNNLVSNALKFTPSGKVTLTAEPTRGDRIRFTVADTGVGFDINQKARIFRPFLQADGSITRRFGGTGLGLSISRQLVDLMDGEMDCDSVSGEGARFWFEIALPPAEAPAGASPAQEPKPRITPMKILVVDDHPANRAIVKVLLEGVNMDVVLAEDGQQALDAIHDTAFDFVLMDMLMPVMDGLDATRAIRQFEAETGRSPTTIAILSADSGGEHIRWGREAGADGHIAKPITLERLLDGMDLANRRNQR